MQLGVGSIATDAAGVEHLFARFEGVHFRPDGANDTGSIPAQHAPASADRTRAAANLRVDRVDRNGPNLNEQVAPRWDGVGKLDIDERFRAIDRAGLLISDCAHLNSCCFRSYLGIICTGGDTHKHCL